MKIYTDNQEIKEYEITWSWPFGLVSILGIWGTQSYEDWQRQSIGVIVWLPLHLHISHHLLQQGHQQIHTEIMKISKHFAAYKKYLTWSLKIQHNSKACPHISSNIARTEMQI